MQEVKREEWCCVDLVDEEDTRRQRPIKQSTSGAWRFDQSRELGARPTQL